MPSVTYDSIIRHIPHHIYSQELTTSDHVKYCSLFLNLSDCRNLKAKSQCDNWVVSKYCTQTFAAWMKTNCASSCGYCVCKDNNNQCAYWAKNNECQKNPKYMLLQCQKSCNVCRPKSTTKPGMYVLQAQLAKNIKLVLKD